MNSIVIIVLAAGSSSRMKAIKQLKKIDNNFLLDIILKKAKLLNTEKIYCILGANFKQIREEISTKDVTFIYNKNYNKGLSSSIVTGIENMINTSTTNRVLILLADQPAISKEYLEEMIFLSDKEKSKIIASKYSNSFGVPAIIPQQFFEELLKISGDKGAKKFLELNKTNIITPSLKTNLFDIDTPEDLQYYKTSTNQSYENC